jgi:hypothetical protein
MYAAKWERFGIPALESVNKTPIDFYGFMYLLVRKIILWTTTLYYLRDTERSLGK